MPLQFLLLQLELARQRLRLLQQVFRARVGLDRMEHDADALGELIEKRVVHRVEALEGGELEDALDLAFKKDGQDHEMERRGLAQTRRDLEVVGRHASQLDLAPIDGALTDQPVAEVQPSRRVPRARDAHSWQADAGPVPRRRRRGRRARPAAPRPPGPAPTAPSGRLSAGRAGPAACARTWRGSSSASPARRSSSVVSFRLRIISLMLSLSAATSACAST